MKAPLLPVGGRLLHIGPHKTGSTTLQAAFHQNRPSLVVQGVHYAGKNAQPMTAAMIASLDRGPPTSGAGTAGAPNAWDRLVTEIDETAAARVMISSEFFCDADPAHIRSILDRLDRARTEVVITLRPLTKILSSQWQQYMQNRMVISYAEWLDAMLNDAAQTTITPSFWRRHRHDALVRNWADVIGPDRVTVVAVDDSDRLMLMKVFEAMLGLKADTLVPRNASANRSLTFPEVEFVRAFNEEFRARDWSEADYTKFVRFGAARHLQQRVPPVDEPRVLTPQWAVDKTVAVAQEMVAGITASGVRVVGDLADLTVGLPDSSVGENAHVVEVPGEIADRFCAGLIHHLESVPPRAADPSRNVGPMEATMRARRELEALEQRLAGGPRGAAPVTGPTTRTIIRALASKGKPRRRRD